MLRGLIAVIKHPHYPSSLMKCPCVCVTLTDVARVSKCIVNEASLITLKADQSLESCIGRHTTEANKGELLCDV